MDGLWFKINIHKTDLTKTNKYFLFVQNGETIWLEQNVTRWKNNTVLTEQAVVCIPLGFCDSLIDFVSPSFPVNNIPYQKARGDQH
jgi:hypothetical protein